MVNVSERPAEAQDRAVPGHWEGDLLEGAGGKTQIGTLVERSTRFTMLVPLPGGKTAPVVADALVPVIASLPGALRRSLTWDQGKEMAEHKRIAVAADCEIYFCDPHSPWQRGSNENTNGLLRQYFPKGMCGRPLRCKKNLWTAAALDRVLPCVRPLLRRLTGRGPVWEFVDQVHIIGARSKRCPLTWFS
jgi:IS30 family transposase